MWEKSSYKDVVDHPASEFPCMCLIVWGPIIVIMMSIFMISLIHCIHMKVFAWWYTVLDTNNLPELYCSVNIILNYPNIVFFKSENIAPCPTLKYILSILSYSIGWENVWTIVWSFILIGRQWHIKTSWMENNEVYKEQRLSQYWKFNKK